MIEDSWFYYFSSLAQTIAAGLALLVALVVIRLQNLSNSLNVIERSVAEAFYQIGKQDDYRSQASPHFLNEHWRVYFINVRRLAESNKQRFSSARDYTIDQGCKLEAGNRRLHRALAYAFGGTLVFAGTAILVIPIAQWISSRILWFSWAVSGILLLVLFVIYFRLVFETLKPKRMEESK
jgi:hypothetical protein